MRYKLFTAAEVRNLLGHVFVARRLERRRILIVPACIQPPNVVDDKLRLVVHCAKIRFVHEMVRHLDAQEEQDQRKHGGKKRRKEEEIERVP